MQKYRVRVRSVGRLSGLELGDIVELDSHDAAQLMRFGLVEPLHHPTEKPTAPPAETKGGASIGAPDEQPRKRSSRK